MSLKEYNIKSNLKRIILVRQNDKKGPRDQFKNQVSVTNQNYFAKHVNIDICINDDT